MSAILHLGSKVGLVHSFNYTGGGNYYRDKLPDNDMLEIKTAFEKSNKEFRYVLAITADKFQAHTFPILKNLKFSKFLTFKSSHDSPDEFLTIWVKFNKNVSELSKLPKSDGPWSCSVRINNHNEKKRCHITTENPNNESYLQVKKYPIWVSVDKKWIKED